MIQLRPSASHVLRADSLRPSFASLALQPPPSPPTPDSKPRKRGPDPPLHPICAWQGLMPFEDLNRFMEARGFNGANPVGWKPALLVAKRATR